MNVFYPVFPVYFPCNFSVLFQYLLCIFPVCLLYFFCIFLVFPLYFPFISPVFPLYFHVYTMCNNAFSLYLKHILTIAKHPTAQDKLLVIFMYFHPYFSPKIVSRMYCTEPNCIVPHPIALHHTALHITKVYCTLMF